MLKCFGASSEATGTFTSWHNRSTPGFYCASSPGMTVPAQACVYVFIYSWAVCVIWWCWKCFGATSQILLRATEILALNKCSGLWRIHIKWQKYHHSSLFPAQLKKPQIFVKEAEFHFRMTLKNMITLIQSIQNILEQGERRQGSSGKSLRGKQGSLPGWYLNCCTWKIRRLPPVTWWRYSNLKAFPWKHPKNEVWLSSSGALSI